MGLIRTINHMFVFVALSVTACSTASDTGGGGSSTGSTSQTGETTGGGGTTAAEGHVCEEDPSVVVWLQNPMGGFVSANVTYSIAGGPRQRASCRQGACFIYDGIDQPIAVYARYQDCPEDELSTFGASCDANAPAEVLFAFYEDCDPGGGTGEEPTPGTSGG